MNDAGSKTLSRRELVANVLASRGEALVVAGLGSPAWDLFAAGDAPENFYLWAGMGLAAPTGLGLALARPERRVLVVTGDGEMMMGVGSLAVIGVEAPANLSILVLDNESFAETGAQQGLTASGVDLAAMARAAGFAEAVSVRDEAEAQVLPEILFKAPGPVLAVAKIALTQDAPAYPSRDGACLAGRFRENLAGAR
jgi:thiamine pyrophosphate-dependent acetolactate synthase large subunit-like protein